MNRLMLLVLGLLAAQSAAARAPVVAAVPDLMIKTRRTFDRPDASVATTIVYLKGARQRLETIVDGPPLAGAVATRRHVYTQISQCDKQRVVTINDDARTYAISPLVEPSVGPRRTEAVTPPVRQAEPNAGDTTITVDAVDTGERRTIGRLTVRRVITTTTTTPGAGVSLSRSNRTEDGWYVDLPSPNCSDPSDRPEGIPFAIVQRPGTPGASVHVNLLGKARRGFPIEEITRATDDRDTATARIAMVEFSEAPLDDSLFTIPPDYRPALPLLFGGYDLSKPDTIVNRLGGYWDGLSTWADSWLRVIWR